MNTAKRDEWYDRIICMIQSNVGLMAEDIPSAALRVIVHCTKIGPHDDLPVSLSRAIYDCAQRWYARSKGYTIATLATRPYWHLFNGGTMEIKNLYRYSHLIDRKPAVPIHYISEWEYNLKYDMFVVYAEAILSSRRFYRRTIRGVCLFDFDLYPDHNVMTAHQLKSFYANPFGDKGKLFDYI